MRNTICAALTTITLTLCTALAGCGGMAKASTPAHAVKPIDSQCTDGGTTHGFYECAITLSDTRKGGLCRLRMGEARRHVLRLGSRERRGQGTTVKIWSQCGAVCIAPEDDEERQACEIAVNALLRWSAEHDKEKEQQ